MPPEDIDDLFRNQLDGHATPPGEALWARLQAHTPPASPPPADAHAERLDQLFRQGLRAHPTPAPRQLWERLEDEHLRPRQRRATAWWPVALAAAVALLLVAGGAGLWLGWPGAGTGGPTGTLATRSARPNNPTAGPRPSNSAHTPPAGPAPTVAAPGALAANSAAGAASREASAAPKKNQAAKTTPALARASSASKAQITTPGSSPRHSPGLDRQPDAAAARRPLVARATAPAPGRLHPTATDEPRLAPNPAPVAAVAPAPVPAPETGAAVTAPAPSLASTGEVITVDVRNGADPGARPAATIRPALAAEAPTERRLGGRLLQQAGHLVRGERVSLAEIAGLPETVTVHATVAGRKLTKSIQL